MALSCLLGRVCVQRRAAAANRRRVVYHVAVMIVQNDYQHRLRPLPELPVPGGPAHRLGDMGEARFVALFPEAGAVGLGDGRSELAAEADVWAVYAGHPRIAVGLRAAGFGADSGPCILFDRCPATVHVDPRPVVERFLREQWLRGGADGSRDATGKYERTLDGLKKAVESMEDTSTEETLNRAELRRRQTSMQQWLDGLG